jgi:hypothetical protein
MSDIQYTIRKIPIPVDQALRKRAEREDKPFNTVVVEALAQETIGTKDATTKKKNALERLWGANTLDEGFYDAIDEQSKIDPEIWK